MARIRTIKPEFFTSEDITELSPLARLLYIALWCEADREGRLVWKPKTFKIRYLPVDECDMDALCQELFDRNLVLLYGDGLAYIPTFLDHQHINPREQKSTLPEPKTTTRKPRVNDASVTREPRDSDVQGGRERKGKEGKGREHASNAFQPPTVEDARAYALSQFQLNSTFAEDFIRDNSARDWKDREGKPYQNWKLLMGTWVKHLKPEELAKYRHKPPPDNSMVKR